VKRQRAVRESNPVVFRREPNERQTKQDIINEICAAYSSYSVEGDSAILLFLRKSSPMKDVENIEALSIPERAKANTRIPKLSYFLQSTVEALEERERAAVKQHREQGSKPPWYDDDQGATERKAVKYGRCYYCSEPTLSGIYCCCDDAQQHRDTVSE
jgi:hypothetical protein